MTKIDVFSGFLGAGKTTLIKKLIQEAYAGEKIVLIENEFGEIGIDGGFIKDAGVEITEMNSGCICCSLVGNFTQSLHQVLEQFAPDRILIEPSGVGKLSDVIKAVNKVESDCVKLNATVAVADAMKCKVYAKNFGEFYNDQIAHADCIVLSRTSGMEPEKQEAVIALLREKNPEATIVATPWELLNGEAILETMEKRHSLKTEMKQMQWESCPVCGHEHHHHHHDDECDCHEHHHHHHDEECDCHEHHHHHADEVFDSWGVETTALFEANSLLVKLEALSDEAQYGMVLRAKGILPAVDGSWIHFDYVPDSADVRSGSADVIGRICVIGSNLNKDALEVLFLD